MKLIIKHCIFLLLLTLVSCSQKNQVVYLQDTLPGTVANIPETSEIKAQPLDKLQIIVNSKDNTTAMHLTLHTPSDNGTTAVESYTVDKNGDITFPLLGEVKVQGLTKLQIQEKIQNELKNRDLLKDPIVTVKFVNVRFVINGEVNKPGVYAIDRDRLNILEAITIAGDLTILGKRENVKVIREENGKLATYQVDLRSKDLFQSPVYYLRQNDVIYIEPNNVRKGQSTINDNSWKSVSLWVSMASVLASIAVLIFK